MRPCLKTHTFLTSKGFILCSGSLRRYDEARSVCGGIVYGVEGSEQVSKVQLGPSLVVLVTSSSPPILEGRASTSVLSMIAERSVRSEALVRLVVLADCYDVALRAKATKGMTNSPLRP